MKFTAVVDPAEAARDAMAATTGARAFTSLEQALAARRAGELDLDAVIICTPPSVRVPLVKAALAADLAVLAEKPLAQNADAAAALVALADQHPQCATAVAYCHRFTPALVMMRDLIAAGRIGRPIRFENTFACWHPSMQSKWMSDATVAGGGSFIDTGCHSLDLFGFLFGGIEKVGVEAALLHHGWTNRAETNATVLCSARLEAQEAANGAEPAKVAGVIASGWAEAERFTVDVVGTAGTLTYDFIAGPETLRFVSSEGQAEDLAVTTHDVRFKDQLEAFADLIARPSRSTRLATFAQGARVARLVEDAYGRSHTDRLETATV